MSKGSKPTPPPLDADEQAAVGNTSAVPHAESGKATAEDAQRAAAADARLAATADINPRDLATARTAPAPAAPEVTAAANVLAAGKSIPAEPLDLDGREPPALISDSGGQLVARPNPQVPLDPKADLVLMNWFGHVEGPRGEPKQVHVKYGTPFGELPRDVQQAIRRTKGVQVGPMPPKAPQNPFTP